MLRAITGVCKEPFTIMCWSTCVFDHPSICVHAENPELSVSAYLFVFCTIHYCYSLPLFPPTSTTPPVLPHSTSTTHPSTPFSLYYPPSSPCTTPFPLYYHPYYPILPLLPPLHPLYYPIPPLYYPPPSTTPPPLSPTFYSQKIDTPVPQSEED